MNQNAVVFIYLKLNARCQSILRCNCNIILVNVVDFQQDLIVGCLGAVLT